MDPHNGKEQELQALISLIDEPDYASFAKVREQIFNIGTPAVPLLEDAWENTFDTGIQQRIEDIIHNIQFNQLHFDLVKWSHFKDMDLLEGFILFTKYQYPSLNIDHIRDQIHQLRRDIWIELNENLTPLEKVKVMNHIIYDHYKFKLPEKQEAEVKYLFLNNLLETKVGYSISIGILYTLLAQSLGMPMFSLLLPGERYFIAWIDNDNSGISRVKFCINPENKGGIFTKEELIQLLKKLRFPTQENYFVPLRPPVIVEKMFEMLSYLYEAAGDHSKQDEITRLRDACTD
ncbi:MAG: transglutaminase family protein [Chloroflexota bacterium]|nr:transglutaminase family protein [Lentimicrobium sp.]